MFHHDDDEIVLRLLSKKHLGIWKINKGVAVLSDIGPKRPDRTRHPVRNDVGRGGTCGEVSLHRHFTNESFG